MFHRVLDIDTLKVWNISKENLAFVASIFNITIMFK